MVRGKALAHCGLVLLSLWLCIQSVPISVDKTKEIPHEELEPPQSAVSHIDGIIYWDVTCKSYSYCNYAKLIMLSHPEEGTIWDYCLRQSYVI